MKTPLLAALLAYALPATALATPFNWTGSTNGNWATGTNWDAGVPASATTTALVFDNTSQLTTSNNIAGGLTLNSLTLTANSGKRVLNGNKLAFDGAAPTLTMVNMVGATADDNTIINTPIQMNQTLSITGGVDFTHQLVFGSTAVFSGTGGLTWAGGIGFINATNTYSGPTLIAAGRLGLNKSGAFGSSAGVTVASGADLQLQDPGGLLGVSVNKPLSLSGTGEGGGSAALHAATTKTQWSGLVTLAADASVGAFSDSYLQLSGGVALAGHDLLITPVSTGTVELASVVAGTGNIIKSGAGTALLSATPTFTGTIDVQEGTFTLGASNVLPGNFPVHVAAGGTLDTGGFAHTIDGSGLTGTGDVMLSSNNTFTVDNASNQTLTMRFLSDASDVATFEKAGAGILTLSAADNDVLEVNINAGTLRLGVDQSFGPLATTSANVTTAGSAVFDVNGHNVAVVNLLGSSAAAEVRLGTGTLTAKGIDTAAAITGAGGIVIDALNTSSNSTFSGPNTFTGGLTIRGKADLVFSSSDNLGGTGNVISLDDGGLVYSGSTPIVLDSGISLNVATGGARFSTQQKSLSISGQLTGSGPVNFSGGSLPGSGSGKYEVRLTNPNNTFTGNIGFSGEGSFGIVADGSLGHAANVVSLGGNVFDGEAFRPKQGGLRAYGNLTLPATRSIHLDGDYEGGFIDTNGFNVTVNGIISEATSDIPLVKDGAGTLFLNGANIMTGITTVLEGTLGGTGVTGPVDITGTAVLAPGQSAGTLHTGNLSMISGTTLALDFASAILADQLNVTGTVTLNGNVNLAPTLGYIPAAADTFIVIANDDSDPVAGGGLFTFGGAPLVEGATFASGGAGWKISYVGGTGNDVTLTVQASAPAAAILLDSFTLGTPPGGAAGREVTATITGPANTLVNLRASDELQIWTIIATATTSGAGTASFNITDPAATGPRRFYQVTIP